MNFNQLIFDFKRVRDLTLKIVEPLKTEDFVIQSIPEVSPPKWHLGHTSWFFEKLVLEKFIPSYNIYDQRYFEIFNSYYKSLGAHWNRTQRGVLSRPSVEEILKHRTIIDQTVIQLLEENTSSEIYEMVRLGIHHEQQHQELLFMDIKNIMATQAIDSSYIESQSAKNEAANFLNQRMIQFEGGLVEIGFSDRNEFFYDNEGPRHKTWLEPFRLSNKLVTNFEYLNFINDKGYSKPEFWLSDGWAWVQKNQIQAPLYWSYFNNDWHEYQFDGLKKLDSSHPVSHISYYEASAYARYANKRLPTEQEWELIGQKYSITENAFLNIKMLKPNSAEADFSDLHGQLWQWTQSAYLPYHGHKWVSGPLGEYNSKFMINQMVLRGGCFATDKSHYRTTYRNFFYPHDRWMFSGIRLAEDI